MSGTVLENHWCVIIYISLTIFIILIVISCKKKIWINYPKMVISYKNGANDYIISAHQIIGDKKLKKYIRTLISLNRFITITLKNADNKSEYQKVLLEFMDENKSCAYILSHISEKMTMDYKEKNVVNSEEQKNYIDLFIAINKIYDTDLEIK